MEMLGRCSVLRKPCDAMPGDGLEGLGRDRKALPCRWLNDKRNSALFDQITHLEAYYPSRTKTSILEGHAGEISRFTGVGASLIEYGAGAGRKTEVLLEATSPKMYVPIDISTEFFGATVARLHSSFPIRPSGQFAADFTKMFDLPAVGVEVAVDLLLPVRFGRDHRYRASFVHFGSQPVGVESLVPEEHIEFDVLDQRFHPDEVVALARQQNETNQVSQCIYQRDDLRGQSTAGPSDRLTMSPPLAPVRCWWTRTIVPSIMAYSKSGSPDNRSKRRSKTPFTAHRRKRRKFEFQLPKLSGKSRHGAPVAAIHKTASRNLSPGYRPMQAAVAGAGLASLLSPDDADRLEAAIGSDRVVTGATNEVTEAMAYQRVDEVRLS
jgi:hypothetical protein